MSDDERTALLTASRASLWPKLYLLVGMVRAEAAGKRSKNGDRKTLVLVPAVVDELLRQLTHTGRDQAAGQRGHQAQQEFPNLPKPIADRLIAEITAVTRDPATIAKYMAAVRFEPEANPRSGEAFKKAVLDDYQEWKTVVEREKIVVA